MKEELRHFTVRMFVYEGDYTPGDVEIFSLEAYVDTMGHGDANTNAIIDELQAMLSKWTLTWLRRNGSAQLIRREEA